MAEADPEVDVLVKPSGITAVSGGGGNLAAETTEDVSDTELDELLDQSLGEFGKHVPQPAPQAPQAPQAQATETLPPLDDAELDEMFSSEFVAEAESQLGEAMKMLSSENPQLWNQFETFAKSMGLDDKGAGPFPPVSGVASKGESSVDTSSRGPSDGKAESGVGEDGGVSDGGSGSLEQKLEDTMKRMQDNASRVGPGSSQMEGLGDMLGQLDLGSEEGEDHFMKMMQGMMSTLLSKDLLYPSLVDLCKQYPDWLSSHKEEISAEDYQRYSKQLEVMETICREFESSSGGPPEASSEKVLQLMQQLQQHGQPPDDMAGENMQQAGLPPGLQSLMGGGGRGETCTVM